MTEELVKTSKGYQIKTKYQTVDAQGNKILDVTKPDGSYVYVKEYTNGTTEKHTIDADGTDVVVK